MLLVIHVNIYRDARWHVLVPSFSLQVCIHVIICSTATLCLRMCVHVYLVLMYNYIAVQVASCGYCSFASRLEEASIYQEPGTYFAYDHKLPCAGNIVSWHYCYYSADMALQRSVYWILLHIFREIDNSPFHRVYSQHIFLDSEPSNKTFVCQKVMVFKPIPVQVGDFLGLDLPGRISLPIPVIGQGMNGSVLYRDAGDASLEKVDGLALHVDAEIGNAIIAID